MKKTSFIKRKPANTDVSLQITSMADIFMILLVFLLKSYSTSMTNVTPTIALSLPETTANVKGMIKDSLKVEIGADIVTIDDKPVIRLTNFEFPQSDEGDFGTSESVLNILKAQRGLLPEPNQDSTLVVMADERVPYSTIKRVIASAAQSGFVDLQLVVIEQE